MWKSTRWPGRGGARPTISPMRAVVVRARCSARIGRVRGLWLLTGGVAEGQNFGEAWGVCAGRPGSSPEPPEDARVVLEEPGLPRVREDRDEVTSKVVRKPREVTVFWWPAPPVEARPGGRRARRKGMRGPGSASVTQVRIVRATLGSNPGTPWSLDAEVTRGPFEVTTRALRRDKTRRTPGSLPRNTHAPEATAHHPLVVRTRAGVGVGRAQGKTRA